MNSEQYVLCMLLVTAHALEFHARSDLFDGILGSEADGNTLKRVKREIREIGDESQDPWEATSSESPINQDDTTLNDRHMPTLSNGHMNVTVYDKALYINGLYEGAEGNSHRAKIPAVIMFRINLTNPAFDEINNMEKSAIRKLHLNPEEGYFMETIDCGFAFIEHRIYVHQKYTRLLVSDIYVVRKENTREGMVLYLEYPELDQTDDIDFEQPQSHYSNWRSTGTIKTTEDNTTPQSVSVYWMTRVEQLPFRGSAMELNETLIMAVDKVDSLARLEFDHGIGIIETPNDHGHYRLLKEHIEAWQETWG